MQTGFLECTHRFVYWTNYGSTTPLFSGGSNAKDLPEESEHQITRGILSC